MEGSLQTTGDSRMLAIIGQLTTELVGPSLGTLTLTHLTELGNARTHRTHVVQRVANHIGHVGNGSLTGGSIEALQRHVAIDDRTLHDEHIALVHHVVQLRNGIEQLRRGSTQGLQVCQSCPVHHHLRLCLALSKCRVVGEELVRGCSRLSLLAILSRDIDTSTTHDDCLVEQATSQRTLAEGTDATCTSTLSEDGHVVGVATKLGDVLLHPFQRLYLVKDAIVTTDVVGTLCRQLRIGHKAKDAQTIVDGDEDDILRGPLLSVELRF